MVGIPRSWRASRSDFGSWQIRKRGVVREVEKTEVRVERRLDWGCVVVSPKS